MKNFKICVDKFEKMVKDKKIIFFDSFEFENIILHYLDNGKLGLAKKALSISLNQYPFNSNLSLLQAEIYIHEDKFNDSIELIDSLLNIEKNNSDALVLKANVLSKMKKHKEAINILKNIVNKIEDKKEIYNQIGLEFLFLEKYEISISYFEKSLCYDKNDNSIIYNIIYCFEKNRKSKGLFNFLKQYLEKNPFSELAWYKLGNEYKKLKKYEMALAAFDFSIISDENFNKAYVVKGLLLEKLFRYDDAIKNYEEMINHCSESSNLLFRIAVCFEKKHFYENSIKFYHKCIDIDPKMHEAYFRIGMFYYKRERFEKALKFIEKAINLKQDKSTYWKMYLKCFSLNSINC